MAAGRSGTVASDGAAGFAPPDATRDTLRGSYRTRSGRGGLRVAVTGAAGPVGTALLTALVAAPAVGVVLGLDVVKVHVDGVRGVVVDVCDPAVGAVLQGVDVVVHLDPDPVLALRPGARGDQARSGGAGEVSAGDGPGDDRVGADDGVDTGGDGATDTAADDAADDGAGPGVDPGADEQDGSAPGSEAADPDAVFETGAGDPGQAGPIAAGRAMRAAQTVLTAAAAHNVGCAILVTSAMVYGAGVGAGVPIPEDAPLLATPDGQALRDMLDVEHVAELARRSHPGLQVCVVRPAALAGPGVDSAVTRYFEAPRLVTVKGEPMRWQFCHLDDLVSALVVLAVRGVGGVATVGCTGWLSQAEVERLAGRGHVELPESLAYGTADRLHRLGLTPVPPGQLRYVTRSWVISSEALRDAGWRPAWANADALEVVLEGAAGHLAVAWRRIGRKETATIGAASATVAVLSTAAIVARAARRHKRR